jgi:hypothetical protein
MEGDPSNFESIGSRLGFHFKEETPDRLCLTWRGARFPAFLCLGIASALLLLSVPIIQALILQGFASRVVSLWYFPVMNLILFGVAIFLLSLNRNILVDRSAGRLFLSKGSFLGRKRFVANFHEIAGLKLGTDQVYSGPSVAGSTVGERFFPALSLRLILKNGATVLLDRGGKKNLDYLAGRLSIFLEKPVSRED